MCRFAGAVSAHLPGAGRRLQAHSRRAGLRGSAPPPAEEALQAVRHKIITRMLKLLTRRGALVEEEGATYMADGDSRHVAAGCTADENKVLEQLCRHITRPALADERVQCNAAGQVVLKLKTPWQDGTTHLVMLPLEFMPAAGCAGATVSFAAGDFVPVNVADGSSRAGHERPLTGNQLGCR